MKIVNSKIFQKRDPNVGSVFAFTLLCNMDCKYSITSEHILQNWKANSTFPSYEVPSNLSSIHIFKPY